MKNYKIYAFLDEAPENFALIPKNINYDILGLHKKRIIVKGELIKIEYYENYDGVNYDNLILVEERTYLRDSAGIIIKREVTIKWLYDDDTFSNDVKNTTKYYSNNEKISEGEIRRKNIISNLKLIAFGLLGQTDAYDLLNTCINEMQVYIDGNRNLLIDKITTLNKTYLDTPMQAGVSIRNYIISELSF